MSTPLSRCDRSRPATPPKEVHSDIFPPEIEQAVAQAALPLPHHSRFDSRGEWDVSEASVALSQHEHGNYRVMLVALIALGLTITAEYINGEPHAYFHAKLFWLSCVGIAALAKRVDGS